MDKYSAAMIAKAQASGASAQVVQAKIAEMQQMKVMYANPLYNVLITFIEPFPVGLADHADFGSGSEKKGAAGISAVRRDGVRHCRNNLQLVRL